MKKQKNIGINLWSVKEHLTTEELAEGIRFLGSFDS
jgi:hypothetical protein